MPDNCLESEIVYKAKINTNNNKQKTYFGLTARTFKERWRRHIDTFKKDSLRDETGISEYIWHCKDKNLDPKIEWNIQERAKAFRPGDKFCMLCTTEKYHILKNLGSEEILNKRSELICKCRHKNKYTLGNWNKPKKALDKNIDGNENENNTDQEEKLKLKVFELKIPREIPQNVLLSPNSKKHLYPQIRTSARVKKKKTFDASIWST